jgi:23S rRNA (guanosine2251-2'-O)-methyltransferase
LEMKEWIVGRNPVYEALAAKRRQFFQLFLAKGVEEKGRINDITLSARQFHIPIEYVDRNQLNGLAENHQGVGLQVSAYPYVDLGDMIDLAQNRKELPFILILDMLQDPQNFGNLIRSAEVFGVHGIIIPPNRAVGVIPSVVHASSGASEHMLIAVSNLAQAIEALKQNDIWVVGLESNPSAQPIASISLKGPLALVVGSEGEGLRELTRKSCDFLAFLPMSGKIESLNAAVAGSIALYLVFTARHTGGK